ncbi:uncharacterized protein LOC121108186 [Gallus gallus]|uniref:uncharacterized protein LOC121108186 n=1 Tax=Gallus gallus TaxID=9031 RepID=UPI001AE87603|nr:uncharacterized protein LOC121108186 [Gallus gallus]XP_046790432.1 uncharacterized protein LOC121108186 [Gallus gallus]
MSVAPVRGWKTKRILTQLEQNEEEERRPEEQLQVLGEPPLSPGEGSSIRSWSPTPRRVTRSPESAGGERDIITITYRSLKMNEIRGLRKDFTHHPKEPIVTWLLRCWDSGADSVLLDSREAHQLGGIARDSAIDRGISTCRNQAFTLWKWMLLAVKERYPFKDDLMPEKRKWNDMEKGFCYLREHAVVEMLHSPTVIPDEPDQEHDHENVSCTPHMWRIFTKTAPESYASTFAAMYDRGGERPFINELVNKLQDFELHLIPLRQPESFNISAIRLAINRRRPPVQASDNSKTGSRFALWHYLCDHWEDMKKWHKKPTSALQARVKELEDRSTTNFSKKVVAPVDAGHGNSQEDNGGNK